MTSDGEVQGTGEAPPPALEPMPKQRHPKRWIIGALVGLALVAELVATNGHGWESSWWGTSTSSPQTKFLTALHAWEPSIQTDTNTNEVEVNLGEAVCHNIKVSASNEAPGVDAATGWPGGTTAVVSGWSNFIKQNSQLFSDAAKGGYSPQAVFTFDADIVGVSVLELCPSFEPAVKYSNQHSLMGTSGTLPTTSNVPQWVFRALRAGNLGATTVRYGYSATPLTPPPTSTTTTLAVPLNQPVGSPPGRGSPWVQAPSDLVAEVKSLAAHDPYGGFSYPAGTTFWLSKDPNNAQWSVIEVNAPEHGDSGGGSGLGVVELLNNSWTVVSAISDQAPGCYGPQGQTLPAGTSAVPSNVLSDFSLSC